MTFCHDLFNVGIACCIRVLRRAWPSCDDVEETAVRANRVSALKPKVWGPARKSSMKLWKNQTPRRAVSTDSGHSSPGGTSLADKPTRGGNPWSRYARLLLGSSPCEPCHHQRAVEGVRGLPISSRVWHSILTRSLVVTNAQDAEVYSHGISCARNAPKWVDSTDQSS